MSDTPYDRVKGGRLTFKGGVLASRSKDIDKKKKRKKKNKDKEGGEQADILNEEQQATGSGSGEAIYTIDAAKKMKYEDLFPVETKKFGYDYDPKVKTKSVEEALDDRIKKKADRYCK